MVKGKEKTKKAKKGVSGAPGADGKGSPSENKKRSKKSNNAGLVAPRAPDLSPLTKPPEQVPTVPSKSPDKIPHVSDLHPLERKESSGSTGESAPKRIKVPNAKSFKYIGLEPEWNSEELKRTPLLSDGFTCCTVLVMEESAELSNYTAYLHQAIGTGIRKNFTSIDGRAISQRVRKFMTTAALREPGQEDDSYATRTDLWAEALKYTLLHHKSNALAELEIKAKEQEITGIRSKEFIRIVTSRFGSPVDSDVAIPSSENVNAETVDILGESAHTPLVIAIAPVPEKPKKNSLQDKPLKKKNKGKKDQDSVEIDQGAGDRPAIAEKPKETVLPSKSKLPKPTLLRKRGELTMPILDFVEDSPPNGPHTYFFLQGFYDPELIDKLQAIGVNIDCVLLITAGTLNKRNFSSLDIEQNIAGTFRPHNILPDYVKIMKKTFVEAKEPQDKVSHFWFRLAEIINQADSNAAIHDIALMNCSIPSIKRVPETIEQKGLFAAKLFDEAAHRIYEMLVLTEWYNEYKLATTKKELQPLEPSLSTTLYERLLNELPAECITVPIIMECLIEQVVENDKFLMNPFGAAELVSDEEDPFVNAGVDWDVPGCRIPGTSTVSAFDERVLLRKSRNQPFLPTPSYIKSYDFASIRTCHLNKHFASHVASSQVCGDFHNIREYLWNKNMPEYNRGLCMKLLGNLNHFMYFLPEGAIRFEEMFYILHLLMAAGVELELQKQSGQAQTAIKKSADIISSDSIATVNGPKNNTIDELNLPTVHHQRSQYEHHKDLTHAQTNEDDNGKSYPGTHLKLDHNHNYVLPQEPDSATKFILAPRSTMSIGLTQIGAGHRGHELDALRDDEPNEHGHANEYDADDDDKSVNKADFYPITKPGHIRVDATHILTHNVERIQGDPQDQIHAGVIAAENLVKAGVDFKYNNPGEAPIRRKSSKQPYPTPPNTATELELTGEAEESDDLQDPNPNSFAPFYNGQDVNGRRFIACEEEWFDSVNDSSILQKLLECPALLAINENGALNLGGWVQSNNKTSNATGQISRSVLGETGPIIGPLENWNYVEELVPVQMIQALSDALTNYLCLDRMYCPFYDTIVFIFTNPTPNSLKTDTEFYSKLQTLPGLQHFLEYSINEDHVLEWLLDLEKNKGVEIVDTFSVTTLMRLVPRDQWMLIPSIKYAILRAQKEQARIRKLAKEVKARKYWKSGAVGDETEFDESEFEEDEDEDDEFGQLKKGQKAKNSTTGRKASGGDGVEKDGRKDKKKSVTDDGGGRRKSKKRLSKSSTSGSAKSGQEVDGTKKNSKLTMNMLSEAGETSGSAQLEQLPPADAGVESSVNPGSGSTLSNLSNLSGFSDPDALNFKPRDADDNEPFKNMFGVDLLDEINQVVMSSTSFNFTDAIKESMGIHDPDMKKNTGSNHTYPSPKFHCYDLGKRVLIAASDTYHLFPMDGTLITYEIASIDPDFHMMQLCIKKNNYATYFYPYYIPHDMDLSLESYVVCPYFHMVHSNGTMFSFQDRRATSGDDPCSQFAMGAQHPQEHPEIFSFDKNVIFTDKIFDFLQSASEGDEFDGSLTTKQASFVSVRTPEFGGEYRGEGDEGEERVGSNGQSIPIEPEIEVKSAKGNKKGKSKKDKGKEKLKDPAPVVKEKKKPKDKKRAKGAKGVDPKVTEEAAEDQEAEEREESAEKGRRSSDLNGTEAIEEEEEVGGEWLYASSENTEAEEEEAGEDYDGFGRPGHNLEIRSGFIDGESIVEAMVLPTRPDINWNEATKLLDPMTHSFRITFPSGLFLSVDDDFGPPLKRIIKQTYLAKSSASSIIEKSRYCTMNGTVVKFLFNKTVQVLTARGVTTTIQELKALTSTLDENANASFKDSNYVKVNKGDVICPSGEHWRIKKGKKYRRDPLFVFNSGVLPNGETFCRRQDGVVYLHRHDGTTITHYPDGTRFTTRMVIMQDPVPEFEDWVFVGLKYMIEHPNYSTVITNSLSGNIHIRMTQGEWARVFADGSIKIGTKDEYKLDVDKYRATVTNPSCGPGDKDIPNLVTVKLWHAHEYLVPTNPVEQPKKEFETMYNFNTGKLQDHAQRMRVNEFGSEDGYHQNQKPFDVKSYSKLSGIPTASNSSMQPPTTTKAKKHHGPKPRKVGAATPKDQSIPPKSLRQSAEHLGKYQKKHLQRPASIKSIGILDERLQNEQPQIDMMKSDEEEEYGEDGESSTGNSNPNILKNIKKFEIDEFLQFTDMWTICKAIDCWDNRFTVDIFGDTIVDKCEQSFEKQLNTTTEKVINAISANFQLPKQYVSGILKTTSSEELSTMIKRQAALANMKQLASCSKSPNTRMFVVKRDLSGIEYLTKANVDKMVYKAKSTIGSMVFKDPLPQTKKGHPTSGRAVRQMIRILEPVQQMESPNGLWKSEYREPVFRPRFMANKPLKIPRPEDLRWFSYILTTAHVRRPKFFLTAREEYLKDKEAKANAPPKALIEAEKAADEAPIVDEVKIEEVVLEPEKVQVALENSVAKQGKGHKVKKGSADHVAKLKQKTSKRASKEAAGMSKAVNQSDAPSLKGRKDSKTKSTKSFKVSKSKLKSIREETDGEEFAEEMFGEDDDPFSIGTMKRSSTEAKADAEYKNLEHVEIPEYPVSEVLDIKGLYGIDRVDDHEIRAQFHPDIEPDRKTIVIRNIMEIPKIDQKMERALLAASMSYSKTIESQKRIYQSYETQATRSPAEMEQQKLMKQHLLEQNLELMHLFEKEAKLL